jgi:hypothetical protein
MPEPNKRVYFHVGAPKTGTTYLQNVLFANRAALAEHGVLYPYTDAGQPFRSMQDFRGVGWGRGDASEFAGEWDKVAARARDWHGPTVIFSNELLGGAPPDRIGPGVASVDPAEVHVVFTARDFARQLVSDWQEHIKHKHTVTLEQFVDDLIEYGIKAPEPFGQMFWGMHDAAYILKRWEGFVPVDRIHVVTVAQPGGEPDTLWRRFCAATGLDPSAYDTEIEKANPSMGVAETELVRRMNFELQSMPPEFYDPLVRKVLAEEVLGGGELRLRLPAGRMDWVMGRSRQLIDELKAAGYPIEGDLEDLMPRPADHDGYVSPTGLTDTDLSEASFRAATGLLRHAGRQRRRIAELQHQVEGTTPPWLRPRTTRDRLRDLYWRIRGRAGRSWLGRQVKRATHR